MTHDEFLATWGALWERIMEMALELHWRSLYGPGASCEGMGV